MVTNINIYHHILKRFIHIFYFIYFHIFLNEFLKFMATICP